ncbi:carbon-nitrogen hydrolase family protein [Cohnella sp. GCM10027633]|uniref:carbon-nitrogen hydrolase family protein n=1 Tax=unclassified Cohnella TaxID=2636738 RepID=UPI003625A9AB
MANRVTISCLGPRPLAIEAGTPPREAIDRMIRHWADQLEKVLPDRPDLIVLPEVCDRPDPLGFPLEEQHAYFRARGSQVRDYLADVAKRHRCYIAYPALSESADGGWLNEMQMIDRVGRVMGTYRKHYPTPDESGRRKVRFGTDAPVFECDFGRVAAVICFDLNFDELRLHYAAMKPDLIVFPSMYHGGLMQGYWAYSCRAHFAGAVAGGPCTILNPLGTATAGSTNYYSFCTATVNLDCAVLHIDENDVLFPAIKRKYGRDVTIGEPGYLGCVLLSSESDVFSADDVIEEFGLERIDDYFDRTRHCRAVAGNADSTDNDRH